jgi:hypothetical protein
MHAAFPDPASYTGRDYYHLTSGSAITNDLVIADSIAL